MKHYLTLIYCTPEVHEVPQAFCLELASLLKKTKGYFTFFGLGAVPEKVLNNDLPQRRFDLHPISDFFSLCENIRRIDQDGDPDVFIVILTKKNNTTNWFSATDGKNIYINVDNLNEYSYNELTYTIAFQILENLFQALCGIVYDQGRFHKALHTNTIGCINDICNDKTEIFNKLKKGTICKSCKLLAQQKGIDKEDLKMFQTLLTSIRNQAFEKLKLQNVTLIEVDEKGNIVINRKELPIEYLPRSIYIFFLMQEEQIHFLDLKKYTKQIAEIYQIVRHNGLEVNKISKSNTEKIRKKVMAENEFHKVVSSIKSQIGRALEPEVSQNFLLKPNGNGAYSIPIEKNKIKLPSKFLNIK